METKTITENFFLVGMVSGVIRASSEAEIEDQDYDMETDLPVRVTGSSNTSWFIETCDWYSDGGICRVEVNHFSLEIALKRFGEMVWAFSCGADGKGGPFEAGPFIKVKTTTQDFENAIRAVVKQFDTK